MGYTDSGQTQQAAPSPSAGNEGNPQPNLVTTHSDLAAARAQRAGSAPTPEAQPSSGHPEPTGAGQSPRSEYIPRERFDEVNSRRIAAEAQLQQLTLMQQQAAAQANSGAAHPQGQQVAQSAQVQDFLATLSSKDEQERWRQKIINQPVTGIAELIQHAIRTEGASLLQQEIHNLQSTLGPLQQYYRQQQEAAVTQYANQRAADPNSSWATIKPVFDNLVQQAQRGGHAMNSSSLQIIESVARMQAGVPVWGQPQSHTVPFTERPSSGQSNATAQPPALTSEQQKVARMLGVDEGTYAKNLMAIRGGR